MVEAKLGKIDKKYFMGSALFCVRAQSCPQTVRGKYEGRYLEEIFFIQGRYLHFLRGQFADRTVRGQ
jgi:hypothetical protein